MLDEKSKLWLLSVVMPVNHLSERILTIQNTLKSLIGNETQVIIIHDISNEPHNYDLEKFIITNELDFVEFHSGNFGSPGKARNFGLQKVKAEWVCFWDSDDKPLPESFILMVRRAKALGFEMAIGSFKKVNNLQNPAHEVEIYVNPQKDVSQILPNPGIWRMAFQSNTIGQTRFSNIRMAEDQIFLLEYEIYKRDILFFLDLVYEYHEGATGQLTKNSSAIQDISDSVKMLSDKLSITDTIASKFIREMFVRQSITAVRKGTRSSRYQMFRFLASWSRKQTLRKNLQYSVLLLRILSNKLRPKLRQRLH